MSRNSEQMSRRYNPGIQVSEGHIGIEVDGRGIQHQPYDRNAPLEDRQAYLRANFGPDHETGTQYIQNQQESDPNENAENTVPSPRRPRLLARWQRIMASSKTFLWLWLALLVISGGTIAASVLAARRLPHLRFAIVRNSECEYSD